MSPTEAQWEEEFLHRFRGSNDDTNFHDADSINIQRYREFREKGPISTVEMSKNRGIRFNFLNTFAEALMCRSEKRSENHILQPIGTKHAFAWHQVYVPIVVTSALFRLSASVEN